MNIRDEEQLQQYFERQMSSSQEQNFLINVAARDDMRLAFRSQLELLKAVREDKDASGSPTFVRSKTLGALGLGGALVPSSLKEKETQAAILSPTVWQSIGSAFRKPALSITAGLLAGILGTSFFISQAGNDNHSSAAPANSIIQTPALKQPASEVAAPVMPASPVENKINKNHSVHSNTTASQSTTTAENPTPIVNNNKAGIKVGISNTMNKPGDSDKK
jgi:hypothetical protein